MDRTCARQHSTGGKERLGGISKQEIVISDGCSLTVQHPLFEMPGSIRKSIPGS